MTTALNYKFSSKENAICADSLVVSCVFCLEAPPKNDIPFGVETERETVEMVVVTG